MWAPGLLVTRDMLALGEGASCPGGHLSKCRHVPSAKTIPAQGTCGHLDENIYLGKCKNVDTIKIYKINVKKHGLLTH